MIANRWKDATSEFARADLEKVWDKVAKTKATLSSSIQNWERSGQRDGCRIDEDDGDEEEPGGGSRDSSVEGVAKREKIPAGSFRRATRNIRLPSEHVHSAHLDKCSL